MQTFRAKAAELGLPSLATAAFFGWVWLQRETAIFATFYVSHYLAKDHPDIAPQRTLAPFVVSCRQMAPFDYPPSPAHNGPRRARRWTGLKS